MNGKLIYPTIDEQEFNQIVHQEHHLPFLIVFSAEWLGEGTIMDGIIENLALEFEASMRFYRIDIDQSEGLGQHLGIRRLPAMYLFNKGEIIDHFSGMLPKKEIVARLSRFFQH